jgi:hypothetical protein
VSDVKKGYILEVNLKVSIYLYNFFADYLLTLEKQIILEISLTCIIKN